MSTLTIAKYLRLSSEDQDLKQTGKLESNSIANQRNLLDAHISRIPEFSGAEILEFCDDGRSGKNFDRPAVQDMLRQVREGKIQCIIVKDLSRFGRDYLTVGNYISRVFPFLGVRFIAVNDGFDSIRPMDIDSLDTSFKTLLYDLYSRDLSRKVRTAKRFRAQKGYFLSPFAPFGYVKDPANKNHLVPDPEAAEVVRRIFQMAADGESLIQIAKVLNTESIPTPMQYKRAAGCSRTVWPCVHEDNFWTDGAILKILRDEQYIGKNIYGKRMRDQVGYTHTVGVSKTEWIIVEGTHEGIVNSELFLCVQQRLRRIVKHDSVPHKKEPLSGKIRCGICGYIMIRRKTKEPYYICRTPRVTDAYFCPTARMPEEDILKTLLTDLRTHAAVAVNLSNIWEERHKEKRRDTAALRKTLVALKENIEQQNQQIKALYESFALGEISKSEYLTIKSAAVKQRDAAADRLAELEASLENMGTDGSLQNSFVSAFGKYTEVEEITSEIVSEVLSEVRIYPDKRLEIVWNFRDEMERLVLELQENHQDG